MKLSLDSPLAKLSDKKYLNIASVQDALLYLIAEKNKDKNDIENDPSAIAEILKLDSLPISSIDFIDDLDGYKKYVLSDKTYKNLSNYKVPNDIRYDVLSTLPNKKYIIQINKNIAFKYQKTDTHIYVMVYDSILDENNSSDFYFYIDLINQSYIAYPRANKEGKLRSLTKSELIKTYYDKVLVTLTYIELTDVTFDICYSNTKRGHILKGNDLKNELSFNVIQVNTNWNITKLHIGDTFQVKGHFRLQPHGSADNKYYKYIFIDTYEKTGIIKRKAGKEINT
jgi:hypothetical protein